MIICSLRKCLVVSILLAILSACTKRGVEVSTPGNPPPSTVPSRTQINAGLTLVGKLSQSRDDIAVVSIGSKIFFAGGFAAVNDPSSRVDIYDISTNSWSIAELSQARGGIVTAVSGNKVYFAGGFTTNGNSSSRLDIYNTGTNLWTILELPESNQYLTGAAAGNKVVFAGGAKANILNVLNNTWEPSPPLSVKPGEGCCPGGIAGIFSTVLGDSIYFAGGVGWDMHNTIDIYNVHTNTWAVSHLKEFKGFAAGIAVGNSNYWAGGSAFYNAFHHGDYFSRLVEIRNINTGLSTIDTLFQGNANFSAALRIDTIVFFTGRGNDKDKFDIYSTTAKTWSIGILPFRIDESNIISVNNSLYVAGSKIYGVYTDKLWRLDF